MTAPTGMLATFSTLIIELSIIFLVVAFLVDLARAWLGPQRIRAALAGRSLLPGMALAAGIGAVTPFCSCSTVPLAAGMLRAGVAFPVIATFLVISPLVNPATFALLAGLAGPAYAALYVAGAVGIALAAGVVVRFVRIDLPANGPSLSGDAGPTPGWKARALGAARESGRTYVRLLPFFALAAFVGALLKGTFAGEWVRDVLGTAGAWGVPLAALVGIPVYASTAVLLPLGSALHGAGVDIGVITAFLMGATGFSIPEAILLKRLVGTRALLVLGATFAAGVVLVGYGFQFLL